MQTVTRAVRGILLLASAALSGWAAEPTWNYSVQVSAAAPPGRKKGGPPRTLASRVQVQLAIQRLIDCRRNRALHTELPQPGLQLVNAVPAGRAKFAGLGEEEDFHSFHTDLAMALYSRCPRAARASAAT